MSECLLSNTDVETLLLFCHFGFVVVVLAITFCVYFKLSFFSFCKCVCAPMC